MTGIRFTRRALRDIRKLPPEHRGEIDIDLDALLENPLAGAPLSGEWKGYRKLRAGDYRVIYRTSAGVVDVEYVRHRREAYRKGRN